MQEANENLTDKQRNRLYKSRITENVGIYCVINFVLGISNTCVYLLLHAKVASVKNVYGKYSSEIPRPINGQSSTPIKRILYILYNPIFSL